MLGNILAGLNLSATTHTHAGSNPGDAWTFTDATGNYYDDAGNVDDSIAKANATISVTPYRVTYDGAAHTAAGTATGVLGGTLAGLDLSATTQTDAGSYVDPWTFTDTTGNYNNASGTVNDTLAKANLTITADSVSKNTGNAVTFTGTEFTDSGLLASDTATGVTLGSPGAPPSAPVGTYVITASNATGSGLGNYNISYVPGALTVSRPSNPTITATTTTFVTAGGDSVIGQVVSSTVTVASTVPARGSRRASSSSWSTAQ